MCGMSFTENHFRVSNISFGLPQREIINAAFFTMAMQNGLSAAIINPEFRGHDARVLQLRALMNLDPQCSEYISVYSGQVASPGPECGNWKWRVCSRRSVWDSRQSGSFGSACQSIVKGLKDQAVQAAKELAGNPGMPLEIINSQIIPGTGCSGKGL